VIEHHLPAIVCEAEEEQLSRFGHSEKEIVAFADSIGYTSRPLAGAFARTLVLSPAGRIRE
jgi:hypothetical protein